MAVAPRRGPGAPARSRSPLALGSTARICISEDFPTLKPPSPEPFVSPQPFGFPRVPLSSAWSGGFLGKLSRSRALGEPPSPLLQSVRSWASYLGALEAARENAPHF